MTPRPDRRAVLGGMVAVGAGTAGSVRAQATAEHPAIALASRNATTSLVILQDGRVAVDWHAPGWPADRPREVASVAKSLVAILVGIAIGEGRLQGLDQSASDFIPSWREDGRRGISVRHLMSMTSGLDDRGLALRGVTGDQFALNAAAPLIAAPGTVWAYNTAAYHLLFHILERAVSEPFEAWASRRLLAPVGMAQTRWLTGAGAGPHGPVTNYYSAVSTAADLARFGEVIRQGGGVPSGDMLVSPAFVAAATSSSQGLNPSYGLLWWANAEAGFGVAGRGRPARRFPGCPPDTVAALGAGGQMVMVIPSAGLVVVRQGDPPDDADFLDALGALVVATSSP
jgi:CubicO group peptidase (beta-lactamase class C family)